MAVTLNPATEADPVRRYTSAEMLREIEERIEESIRFYSAQPPRVIEQRLDELRREWSIERYLQLNVSTVGMLTAVLALTSNRKWALLTCGALGFFLFHGLRGFDPPIPVLRKLGVRTRSEIDREIFGLRVARGDFQKAAVERPATQPAPAKEILRVVNS